MELWVITDIIKGSLWQSLYTDLSISSWPWQRVFIAVQPPLLLLRTLSHHDKQDVWAHSPLSFPTFEQLNAAPWKVSWVTHTQPWLESQMKRAKRCAHKALSPPSRNKSPLNVQMSSCRLWHSFVMSVSGVGFSQLKFHLVKNQSFKLIDYIILNQDCGFLEIVAQLQEVWSRTSHGSKNIHTAGKNSQNWDTFSCSVKGFLFVRLWARWEEEQICWFKLWLGPSDPHMKLLTVFTSSE